MPARVSLSILALALGLVACAAEPEPEPTQEVSGNQPICVEAIARVSALCKGVKPPSFETACAGKDHCRAGCIYDHPCDAAAQSACIDAKGC
ncbi:MAG: hypothetical protein JST00_42435 [Deltaproteobacteria bacterium]|nr:hypothetical protein [Deltaproteobacteria bacterium]